MIGATVLTGTRPTLKDRALPPTKYRNREVKSPWSIEPSIEKLPQNANISIEKLGKQTSQIQCDKMMRHNATKRQKPPEITPEITSVREVGRVASIEPSIEKFKNLLNNYPFIIEAKPQFEKVYREIRAEA